MRVTASDHVERPTRRQVNAARAIVRWYIELYYGTPDDPGVPSMFCDPTRVGAFAVDYNALRAGEHEALFRLLIATTMFQRRQDVQILRILRGIPAVEVRELTDSRRLLKLVDETPCEHLRTTLALRERCDLAKDARTRMGRCSANPRLECHLKRHTVLLKRYGHFGKVPTSAALILREAGVDSLPALRSRVMRRERDATARARALEVELARAWRISQKIACMFLSGVSNPDLWHGRAPWARGVDWTHYVVIDSNVDLFLAAIGYSGLKTYDARRAFVQSLAKRIDLNALDPRLHAYNPRIVQQALYLFMSATNRRALARDCMHLGVEACRRCPADLRRRCPVPSA
jgi:hypothetical protein